MKLLDKKYGDFMPIEKYKEYVLAGCITTYDGFGYYCTSTEESDIYTGFNAQYIDKAKASGFNYVMWYNK